MPLFKKLFLVDNVLNSGSSAARIFCGPESHRAMHLLVFLRHPPYEKDLMSSYGNLVKTKRNEIKTLNPPVKNIKVSTRKSKKRFPYKPQEKMLEPHVPFFPGTNIFRIPYPGPPL